MATDNTALAYPEGYKPPTQQDYDRRHHGTQEVIKFTSQPPVPDGSNEPWTVCLFHSGTKELLANLPGYPRPMLFPKKPAFRVADVPGKGKGLFSTRALSVGDAILTERPLLIWPRGLPLSFPKGFTHEQFVRLSLEENEKHLEVALERMRPEDSEAFRELANCHKEDGSGPLMGIVRTNALEVTGILPPGANEERQAYGATLRYISRLNHSCSPNTQPVFDKFSLSHQLFAVRDIEEGEELTFQYTDVAVSAAERNKELKSYDFVCTCASCTDAPASDARRAAITGFTPTAFIWAVDRALSDDWLLNKCREQLALIEVEGLQHLKKNFDAIKAIMEVYICLGDAENASKWAARVKKQIKWAKEGPDVSPLLDPTNISAYKAQPMWCMRVGDAPPGSVGKMFQEFAALAGRNGVKTLPGGSGFMLFPVGR
ncbi:SET domain-containing protein [Mycena alexandri]|uniref:SET domain-containing protein n=1 Tax=Mycena alexandri TaxID=1745969 RepID=A0AAD6SLT8_9AGAR|nr:SET domain-containing protein [Mycena alexandri]